MATRPHPARISPRVLILADAHAPALWRGVYMRHIVAEVVFSAARFEQSGRRSDPYRSCICRTLERMMSVDPKGCARVSIETQAPASDAFAALVDRDRLARWFG